MIPDTDSFRRMAMVNPRIAALNRRIRNERMKRWVMHHTIITACLAALVLVVLAIVTGGVECAAQWWVG